MFLLQVVQICAICAAFQSSREIPVELRQMQNAQLNAFQTARFEWTWDSHGKRRYYSSSYAGPEMLVEDFGDEEGIVGGNPGLSGTYSTERILRTATGDQWTYREEQLSGMLYTPESEMCRAQVDLRSVGTFPYFHYEKSSCLSPATYVDSLFAEAGATFDVRTRKDRLVDVTATWEDETLTWTLDPEKNWLPVHTVHIMPHGGKDGQDWVRESDSEYQQVDGQWLLSSAELYGEGGFYDRIQVTHAEINQPTHPAAFSVAEALHMVPGINFARFDANGPSREPWMFDGDSACINPDDPADVERSSHIDFRRFWLMSLEYDRKKPGSTPRQLGDDNADALEDLRRDPRLWEQYTRDFVRLAELTSSQGDQAWKSLTKWQVRAEDGLKDKRGQIDAAASELADVRRKQLIAKAKNDAARLVELSKQRQSLEEQLDKLYKPVIKIFIEELRPSLYGLLTDKQKKDILSSSRKTQFLALEAAVKKETLRGRDDLSLSAGANPKP